MVDDHGFLLTRQWRDTPGGVEFEYWTITRNGPVQLIISHQQPVFFLAESQVAEADTLLSPLPNWNAEKLAMKSFELEPVFAYYFLSQNVLRQAREKLLAAGLNPFESDINPYDRYLMERFVRGDLRFRGQPKNKNNFISIVSPLVSSPVVNSPEQSSGQVEPEFKVLSLDIETAMKGLELYSVGIYGVIAGQVIRKVFMVSNDGVEKSVSIFPDEKSLLLAFFVWLNEIDPDIIIGWNVINFDMWFLQQVCEKNGIKLTIGRNNTPAHWRLLDEDTGRRMISVTGRVILDGIDLLKAATYQFESFSLNNVATVLLGDAKLIQGGDRGNKITDLYRTDKRALAEYNIKDCKLVWDIFEKVSLIDFAVARTRITGLPLDRIGGSVASFDFRYLPLLHREGFVAPNGHWLDEIEHSPGGFVMDSKPGLYQHVVVLDFKSLYPSIIRSFKIDPLGMTLALNEEFDQSDLVPGFKGAWFAKYRNILPQLVEDLWQSRDQAKKNNDSALSQAIKIIMNSFYGVLGSGGCRFFDSRLATSITRRGHQIIQQTAEFIERESSVRGNCSVIYGDTDSVFVWLSGVKNNQDAIAFGEHLEQELNIWWQQRLEKEYGIDSALEIEFETHFQKFLMPTVRGSEQGSKKRYAGLVDNNGKAELVFKGLENVRTDWTRLAREFQMEIYRRVFNDEPYHDYIKEMVNHVLNGNKDDQLVYRKRLRRRLDEYQKNIPPQVQAARKAVESGQLKIRRGDWIEYVITVNGAEPIVSRQSVLDYQHYVDKQLAPAVDSILYFHDTSLAQIIDQQISLF